MRSARSDRAKYAAAVNLQRGNREEYAAWQAGRVRPFVITRALDARGLYGPEVNEACGTFEPAIDMWEDGQLYPTWDELKALADLTGYPIAFFTTVEHEPVRFEWTSLRFHMPKGELARPEPVLCFEPEAILAATGTGRCPWCWAGALAVEPVSIVGRRTNGRSAP